MIPEKSHRGNRSSFDETMKLVSYCPLCENRYDLLEAKLLEERDGASLVYLRCRHCGSAIVALLVHNQLGVSSVGLITDLSAEEVEHFVFSEAIDDDTVLNVYQALQETKNVLELAGS